MVESGIKELGAALLAGIVIVAVADFVFMNAQFGKYFHPAFASSPMPAPVNPGTGGVPAGQPGGNGGSLPDPTTC
jgi:hypothetical protein